MKVNSNETVQLVKDALGAPNGADAGAQQGRHHAGHRPGRLRPPGAGALALPGPLAPAQHHPAREGQRRHGDQLEGRHRHQHQLIDVSVSEGNRGAKVTTATQSYVATYKGIGLEDSVSFEADFAAEGFQDVKATAALNLLRAVMIGEEFVLLNGNASNALGTTPTPTLVASASGGTMATQAPPR
jgi:hypothetical protein